MSTDYEEIPNLSAVLRGKNDLRLEERVFADKPREGEVMLLIQSVGVCGSDVHFWKEGSKPTIPDFDLNRNPLVLGHEASAIVGGVGKSVVNLAVGDRVTIEPGISCRHCSFCKSGTYNLCPTVKFGSCNDDGYFTQRLIHPANLCFKLPENLSIDEGALVEPLSVVVYACERAGITVDSKLLICGAGPIGLLCLLAAKAFGASKIIITDIDAGRLEVARKLGATHTLLVGKCDPKATAKEIHQTLGEQPNKTIECSGAESAIATGIYATASGGTLVLVGLGSAEVKIPIVDASVREVDIRGVLRYCNTYPKTIALLASGKIDVKPLITHHYNLKDVLAAFETAKTGKDGAIKVIVHCNEQNITAK